MVPSILYCGRVDQELPAGPRYETLLPAVSQRELDAHLVLRVIPIKMNVDNKAQLKLLRLLVSYCKDPFTLSVSESENKKDQRTIRKDQSVSGKHQK